MAVSYGVKIGSIDSLVLLHMDTLAGLKELQVCRAYEIDGQEKTFFPANIDRLAKAKPIYETLPGWDENLRGITTFDELPDTAKAYVRHVEEIVGRPVGMVGVGPKRSQTIVRE